MIVNCENCGRRHPLSDDDVAFFHPHFFCLSCGRKILLKIDAKSLGKLKNQNDRSRLIPDSQGIKAQETVRHIKPGHAPPPPQGTDGG